MSFFDAFRGRKFKSELEQVIAERDHLKAALADTERMEYAELRRAIQDLTAMRTQLDQEVAALKVRYTKEQHDLEQQVQGFRVRLQAEHAEVERKIAEKRRDLIEMDDEILLQSFGLYRPKYELQTSEAYKTRIDAIRVKQTTMVKSGRATIAPTNWTVNNSKAEGERMVKDYVKLLLRSFNNECDASITTVKFSNVDSIKKRIEKAFETLNTLGKRMNIGIVPEYLQLKMEELYLCHEYQLKKQEEREEQKRVREQLREEAKLARELEEMRLKIGKEEKHFSRALATIQAQLQYATDAATRTLLVQEQQVIELRLAEIERNKQDLLNREQNTRAGYVYIISNIGAFGESVFKIGVTRRLDPQERIDELGDASVPFDFDIHALIFSDNAPGLENALHKAFEGRRLNMINRRREFFHVSLQEIDEVVKRHFNKPYEFVELADAQEYRESLVLRSAVRS